MFSQASVILFKEGGVYPSTHRADTPLLVRHPPWADTPLPLGRHFLLGRHTPGQTPSACWDTHTPAQCMLGYTHPCPVHAGIHPPGGHCSGWYASYWNAFLLPPANVVYEGYVFTHVCHSFCLQGGVPDQQTPPWDQVHPPDQVTPRLSTPPQD